MDWFYRVEHKDKQGPYYIRSNIKMRDWALGPHTEVNGRPYPRLEADLEGRDTSTPIGCRFGFRTLKQLQAWFRPEELKKLSRLGFRIVRVKGIVLWESKNQVCFIEDDDD